MNLSDPTFAARVRKVTMIMALVATAMSLVAMGFSLYALHLERKRAAYEEILDSPGKYPAEAKLIDCRIDGGVTLYPKFMCEYFGGEVADAAEAQR